MPTIVADAVNVPRRRRLGERFRLWRERNGFTLALTLVALLFLVALLLPRSIVQIPAGHVGVLWSRFGGGTQTDFHYAEGVQVIWPWNEVAIYDARLQTNAQVYDTISSNGLSMRVEIAVRYRINPESVGLLHQIIGPAYPEVLIFPEIGSHARTLIAQYTPEHLYAETRGFIQAQILERMVTELGSSLISQGVSGPLIYLEDVLIRSVVLPTSIQQAIERKAEQYQFVLEYDFRLQREELERERKNIEGLGIREFQDIVSDTITDEYLRLRGIDATLALASSNNAKIVLMGGDGGLPVILDAGDFGAPAEEGGATLSSALTQPAELLDPLQGEAVSPEFSEALSGAARPSPTFPGNPALGLAPSGATVTPAEPVETPAVVNAAPAGSELPPVAAATAPAAPNSQLGNLLGRVRAALSPARLAVGTPDP